MIFFYYGTDAFRIKEALGEGLRVDKEALGVPPDTLVFRILPDDEEPGRIFEYLETQSLFDPGRIASVERIGSFPKAFAQDFLEHIEQHRIAGAHNVRVHITHVIPENTKERRKDIFIDRFCKKPAHAKEYNTITGQELFGWVREKALSRGIILGQNAAHTLTLAHGNDLAVVSQEIEKLALYLNANSRAPKEAGPEELAKVGWERITQDGFRLIDAMGRKDHPEMLCILLKVFAIGEDPIKILGLLSYALRAMLAVKEAESRPISPADLPAVIGLQSWQIRQYRNTSAHFSIDDLKKIYERLLTADYKIKTGEGNPRLILEQFLLRT
ncbi:MAG: DNA polymerase III subunit delta [bacterium]|nr:DNA polymerase III subunit delta [bacterium]